MGKTVFNRKWLYKYSWVKEVKSDNRSAYCSVCRKNLDLCKMGESALKSHMLGSKHKLNERMLSRGVSGLLTVSEFMVAEPEKDAKFETPQISNLEVPSGVAVSPSTKTVLEYGSRNDVLKAEILWTLKTVCDHSSYRSNENAGSIFKTMFPDSPIASKFACGERKTAYISVFGIAPFFLDTLKKSIKGKYCVLFDESLNKKSQQKQMDIHVRFWTEDNKVITTYFGSQFLGKFSIY